MSERINQSEVRSNGPLLALLVTPTGRAFTQPDGARVFTVAFTARRLFAATGKQ